MPSVVKLQKMSRLQVLKTYKIYINGAFPRTESGRYYIAKNKADLQAKKELAQQVETRMRVVLPITVYDTVAFRYNRFDRKMLVKTIIILLDNSSCVICGHDVYMADCVIPSLP